MASLPKKYDWLNKERMPKMLVEAIKHYGVLEYPGKGSNQVIIGWATETGVRGWYLDDSVPWCGLFVGVVAKRAGYPIRPDLLSALSWAKFGMEVQPADAKLWDILVFIRTGGGHVGFYVGEDKTHYCVFGGNQSDAVGFTWIEKSRLYAVRRPAYKIGIPANVRKIWLNRDGSPVSTNEA